MSDQGKANYEAYRKLAGRPGVSAAPLPEYKQLPMELAYAFDAGAVAVEAWLADAPVDEDMPGNEPQPAKVIVVRDENNREHRYAAPNFGMLHDGTLVIGDKRDDGELRVDAMRAHGRWTSAHKDDVLAPDSTARALGTARRALDQIANSVLEADDPRREVVRIARDAVAELDL